MNPGSSEAKGDKKQKPEHRSQTLLVSFCFCGLRVSFLRLSSLREVMRGNSHIVSRVTKTVAKTL
jgi:hypothetical protein